MDCHEPGHCGHAGGRSFRSSSSSHAAAQHSGRPHPTARRSSGGTDSLRRPRGAAWMASSTSHTLEAARLGETGLQPGEPGLEDQTHRVTRGCKLEPMVLREAAPSSSTWGCKLEHKGSREAARPVWTSTESSPQREQPPSMRPPSMRPAAWQRVRVHVHVRVQCACACECGCA